MKTEIKYYAQLVKPYKDKYGDITSIETKIHVRSKPDDFLRELYSSFGKDRIHKNDDEISNANYPKDFTVLDYVKKHHEIVIQYGHGSAEFESVPCRLFKETSVIEKTVEEI